MARLWFANLPFEFVRWKRKQENLPVNENRVVTDRFSHQASERLYRDCWPAEPQCREQCEQGQQCGGCSFYAKFNADYGLCCNRTSRHFTETVFEHFTCPAYVHEGWGPHSFSEHAEFHCRCGGEPDSASTEA